MLHRMAGCGKNTDPHTKPEAAATSSRCWCEWAVKISRGIIPRPVRLARFWTIVLLFPSWRRTSAHLHAVPRSIKPTRWRIADYRTASDVRTLQGAGANRTSRSTFQMRESRELYDTTIRYTKLFVRRPSCHLMDECNLSIPRKNACEDSEQPQNDPGVDDPLAFRTAQCSRDHGSTSRPHQLFAVIVNAAQRLMIPWA
ncbi:hypothetical protein MRB53_039970 [Persea americana]|nr:hypothetical protein MRB53_039970 [Persea americana]